MQRSQIIALVQDIFLCYDVENMSFDPIML